MGDPGVDLLAAASDILATEGLAGLTVRRVAEAAGCSTMAIYSRFGGKSGLFEALARQGFERLAAAQAAAADAAGDSARDRLHAMCRSQREVARADPLRYRLMFGAIAELGDEARRAARASIELLAAALEQAAPSADSARAAELLFAVCHGVISAELAAVIEPSDERLRDAVDRALPV